MKILSREDILNSNDIAQEHVDVPEWGGTVIVRALSGQDRDAYEKSIVQVKRGKGGKRETDVVFDNLRAKLVARSIVGEDGEPLFTSSDINALGTKSAAALNRVFDVAQNLSGLSQEDIEELTEGLVENPTEGTSSEFASS